MVGTHESTPNSYLSTYPIDATAWISNLYPYIIAKLVPGVKPGASTYWSSSAYGEVVNDEPGKVDASFSLGGVTVTTQITPLPAQSHTGAWQGAAIYSIQTSPLTPIRIRCGGIGAVFKMNLSWLTSSTCGSAGDAIETNSYGAILKSGKYPLTIVAKPIGGEVVPESGIRALFSFDAGTGSVLITYSTEQSTAETLSQMDVSTAVGTIGNHYDNLLENTVTTPDADINAAFRSALYNLEYNYFPPYGWVECIQHWMPLWHMQHTAGASWIGQLNRARDCNLVMAANLLPYGAAPQFFTSGKTRRDFGGSNQFYAWQLRHYWRFTANVTDAQTIAPALKRVVDQTFEENDTDNDLLLSWWSQIGNQEDYVHTPHNGTSPSIEGINMMKTYATYAEAAGNSADAAEYNSRAETAEQRLWDNLWMSDLGRFMFFRDTNNVPRFDGQYHTLIYPAIRNITGLLDSWTSIRHMRDRLTGSDDRVYCGNNFPYHVNCTCGPQAGAAQQPWAAKGLAKVGLRNETFKPLRAIARNVMNADHRGSWPEVAEESTAAYFSPPAGLFVQAVVENLFGLEMNKPENVLNVSPSFPDAWPSAQLDVAEAEVNYTFSGNTRTYTVKTDISIPRKLSWKLPPGTFNNVLLNGAPASYSVSSGVSCVELIVDTSSETSSTFSVNLSPATYNITSPPSVAEGDSIAISATGCEIIEINDRCGVITNFSIPTSTTVSATVRKGLLEPYLKFARLGLLNFSRRTFFLKCRLTNGQEFWHPVEVAVLPKYEAEEIYSSQTNIVNVTVRNNSQNPINESVIFTVAGCSITSTVNVSARNESTVPLTIPQENLAEFSPGDNLIEIDFSSGGNLDITATYCGREVGFRDYEPLPLPKNLMIPDTDWKTIRPSYAYGHGPWNAAGPPLAALENETMIYVSGVPGVPFEIQGRNFIPLSQTIGSPSLSLDLNSRLCKKIYFLIIPFLDNHDVFSPVARVTVNKTNGGKFIKELTIPGDFDWWMPQNIIGMFSTAWQTRSDRYGLLPQLSTAAGDWSEGRAPTFPRSAFWAEQRAVKYNSAVMNLIEIDLPERTLIESVTIETIGTDPALGLVAATVDGKISMVKNSGFEHILGGTEIIDWETSGSVGINGSFFDNGTKPEGNNVCYLQNQSYVSQLVSDLVSGVVYAVALHANASEHGSANATLEVKLGGVTVIGPTNITAVGGSLLFPFYSGFVLPTNGSAILEIHQTIASDNNVLLIDDVRIFPVEKPYFVNGSFEYNGEEVNSPGYVTSNYMDWWTTSSDSEIGRNTESGTFFDNGRSPDRFNVCFIKGQNSIQQKVYGFEDGAYYSVSLSANAANSGSGSEKLEVKLNGSTIIGPTNISAAGGLETFQSFQKYFETGDGDFVLEILQTDSAAGSVLLVDDIHVEKASLSFLDTHSFEPGILINWIPSGPAWEGQPRTDLWPSSGYDGTYHVCSYLCPAGVNATGVLRSAEFSLGAREQLSFYAGGWSKIGGEGTDFSYVTLNRASDDTELDRIWAPGITGAMKLRQLAHGQNENTEVYIEVVDDDTANTGWGWISVDDFDKVEYNSYFGQNNGFELGNFDDWTLTGSAFTSVPESTDEGVNLGGWHGRFFACSRKGGEPAVGTLRSPDFPFGNGSTITFLISGWSSWVGAVPPDHNYVALKRASDNSEIERIWAPNVTHTMLQKSFGFSGAVENVYIEVVDDGTDGGYAWIAVDDFQLDVIPEPLLFINCYLLFIIYYRKKFLFYFS